MPLQCHLLAGTVLVLGRAQDSGRHAHRSAQLVLALEAPFRLDLGEHAEADCTWAVIAPQCSHRIRGDGQRIAHLFVDPGPQHWQRWLQNGGVVRPPDADLRDALRAATAARLARPAAEALARRWRQHSLPGLVDGVPGDPRIARAVALIDRDPLQPELGHRQLAAQVHVSASRFLALFRAQVGLPVRNYLLWRRLLLAVELLESGLAVTAAAHAAGFADAAHLSRSFRRILGAAPSEIRLPGETR